MVAKRQQRRFPADQLPGARQHEFDDLLAVIRRREFPGLADESRQMVLPLLEQVNQPGVDQRVRRVGRDSGEISQVLFGEGVAGRTRQRQHAEPLLIGE